LDSRDGKALTLPAVIDAPSFPIDVQDGIIYTWASRNKTFFQKYNPPVISTGGLLVLMLMHTHHLTGEYQIWICDLWIEDEQSLNRGAEAGGNNSQGVTPLYDIALKAICRG
jgi:hypothetical protein